MTMKAKQIVLAIITLAISLTICYALFCPQHLCLRSTCSKNARVLADRNNIQMAARLYEVDIGQYPTSISQLVSNVGERKGWQGPYLTNGIPVDPWGKPYSLENDDQNIKE
jgi:general secretion pathway protein G